MKPPTAERSDAGPKMKFFTPELMIRFNSLDDDEADQDWDAALHAYRNHTADLRVRFRKPLEQLMHLSLHDAELLANLPLIELSSPFANGEELRCSVIDVRQGDQIISLTYFLGGEVQVNPTPVDWPFSRTQRHWLHDEVDSHPTRPELFLHRILWSDGQVEEIPCAAVLVHTIHLPVATTRQTA